MMLRGSRCLPEYSKNEVQVHTVRACGGQEALLNSPIQGRKRLASLPGCFIPGKNTPRTHRAKGWVGFTVALQQCFLTRVPREIVEKINKNAEMPRKFSIIPRNLAQTFVRQLAILK
jgi:hypothetical protein